jgi:hypothetical protein
MTRQLTSQPTRLHRVDIERPAGEQQDNLLAHGNGVAGLSDPEVLLQRLDEFVGFREPTGV